MTDSPVFKSVGEAVALLLGFVTIAGCNGQGVPSASAATAVAMNVEASRSGAAVWRAGTPTYANDETRESVERMVEAHGGLPAWEATGSFAFTANMYLASVPLVGEGFERSYYDNWRHYRVTVEPATSRGTVEIPFERPGEARIGFDGTRLWSLPYDFDPPFRDGPLQMMYYHYSMVVLPFLTQQDDVVLERVGEGRLPSSDEVLDIVEMRFEPEGRVHDGHFQLYVDPSTHRLRGFRRTAGFPLLPGSVFADDTGAGGTLAMARVIDTYVEAGGLLVPRSYTTLVETEEGVRMMGVHLILDPEVSSDFDAASAARREGSRVVLSRDPGEAEEGR